MTVARFTIPNWGQELFARAIGLDPKGICVRLDNDQLIVFKEYKSGLEYMVSKSTGEVQKS